METSKIKNKPVGEPIVCAPISVPPSLAIVYNLRQANVGIGGLLLCLLIIVGYPGDWSQTDLIDWVSWFALLVATGTTLLVGLCLTFRGPWVWRVCVIAEVVAVTDFLATGGYLLYLQEPSGNVELISLFYGLLMGTILVGMGLAALVCVGYLLTARVRRVLENRTDPSMEQQEPN